MQPLFYDLPDHRISFIATPKCATTSIMDALTPLLPETDMRDKANPHERWRKQQITQKELRDLKADRFIFAPVRNPWSRVVSHYKDKIVPNLHERLAQYGFRKAMPFDDYLKIVQEKYDRINDFHIIEQVRMLNFRGAYLPDFTMRFERLGEDFQQLRAMINARTGIDTTSLGQLNTRQSRSFETYYTTELREMVHQIYIRDIEVLNYRFDA